MDFLQDLAQRGLLKQITNKDKFLNSQKEKKAVYCGIDPTAKSLHVGHLLQIILLYRFLQQGFQPIIVIGKFTGMIGDPSGKSQERVLLDNKIIEQNTILLKKQLKHFFKKINIKILTNDSWLKKIDLFTYLRTLGKDFNINYILNKESVSERLSKGISYTEFSYILLQAYDFWYLYNNHNCAVQIGGSDQWGNITAGIELIRKRNNENHQASGLTVELLIQSNGVKFGKTQTGTIWLDSKLTSPYELYQFFINQSDEDVEKLLKWLTLLPLKAIKNIISSHQKNPEKRIAQKKLAFELVSFVHSEKEARNATVISEALFYKKIHQLTWSQILQMKQALSWLVIKEQISLLKALILLKVCDSNNQARILLKGNSIYVNDKLVTDENYLLDKTQLLHSKVIFIRKGRKYFVLEFSSN